MFTFTVHPDNAEPFEVKATSRDVARWEMGGRGRSLGKLAEDPSMSDLYDLAFVACARLDLYAGDIREFRATTDLEFKEDEAADPTQLAR